MFNDAQNAQGRGQQLHPLSIQCDNAWAWGPPRGRGALSSCFTSLLGTAGPAWGALSRTGRGNPGDRMPSQLGIMMSEQGHKVVFLLSIVWENFSVQRFPIKLGESRVLCFLVGPGQNKGARLRAHLLQKTGWNIKAGGTQLVAMHYGPSYVKHHPCGRKGTSAGYTISWL